MCHYIIISLHHHTILPLRQYTTTSLHHYITTSLHHHITTPLLHYTILSVGSSEDNCTREILAARQPLSLGWSAQPRPRGWSTLELDSLSPRSRRRRAWPSCPCRSCSTRLCSPGVVSSSPSWSSCRRSRRAWSPLGPCSPRCLAVP